MPEISSIKDNVDLIRHAGRNFYLIGTAHISESSADLAEEMIRAYKPDSVAVELCEARYQSLHNPARWKNTDIVSVIRQGKAYVLMAQLMLAAFQKKLGDKLKVKPGAEMMRAVKVAQELHATVVLADRDVGITLRRVWGSLGFWTTLKLIGSVMAGLFQTHEIDEQEIERLKSSDALDELMREFSEALPEVRNTLIDERDQFLASTIAEAPGETVVAVVGAGHIAGIKKWFGIPVDRASLERIPPPNRYVRVFGWIIPALLVILLGIGFIGSGSALSLHMLSAWVWITGGFAAFGAAISLAHPLTILSAFVASPITTIHPLLASGWVAGLVEAVIRRPRVSDLESITDDLATLKGIWRNRLSRILLIMALTNLFGSIGALVGIKVVASML